MFPHRYCLVTLETGKSQMRESLAARAWTELEWDKKRILADHKWLRGEMTASRELRGEQILWGVCFVPDTLWESFMAGLIYYPMKQINGEEMNWAAAKILQWLAHWTLRTAAQRRWMWVLQLSGDDLSHANCGRQIYNGVFTESHATVINHFLRKYLLSLWVRNGSRW